MSAMRLGLFLLSLLLAAPTTESAPAPVYREPASLETAHRALPERLRYMIDSFHRHLPESIDGWRRDMIRARTEKDKESKRRTMEHWKAEFYRHPIDLLEYQRQQQPYQGREDQQKIATALKYYRLQYHEAKKKGLFTEPPGMQPLK